MAPLRAAVGAISVDDAQIREQIAAEFQRNGRVWCPHTATAMWVYRLGPEKAKRMMFTGDRISGREAVGAF